MSKQAGIIPLLVYAAVALLALTLHPADALAQCALCKTAVEQGGGDAAKAMNLGILVLLVPPVAAFCTIFAVAVRSEKSGRDKE